MAYATLKQLGLGERISDPDRDYHIRFADFSRSPMPYSPLEMYTLFVESDWENNYQGRGGVQGQDRVRRRGFDP